MLQHKTGLPISTYFSAVKLRWLMDNVDEVHQAVVSHRAMFGTVDSWLIWVMAFFKCWTSKELKKNWSLFLTASWQCLTGGKSGGVHCTDVTNASRTMLFNIHTMNWDPELCKYESFFVFVSPENPPDACQCASYCFFLHVRNKVFVAYLAC